jgi:hypothetical protein
VGVALDANAVSIASGTGATSFNYASLTIGTAGFEYALVVQLNFSNTAVSGLTLTWDNGGTNQAMTLIGTANGGGTDRAELWGLLAPTPGNKTLHGAWTGASDYVVNSCSWTGVDQGMPATSFLNFTSATGNSTTPALVVTSAAGNIAIDNLCVGGGLGSAPTPTQTQLYSTTAAARGGGSYGPGAATVNFGWTLSIARDWIEVGCDIVASPGLLWIGS